MADSKSERPARGRRGILRWIVGIAAVLAGLFVFHAAAARWLLSTPTLRKWIKTRPETTWVDWDEAASVWTGLVRVRGVRIRGRDNNVQWIFRIEQGRLRYSILELAARRFHVLRLDVDGLSFRLRKNLRPDDPRPTPVALQPPILGFSDPPRPAPARERRSLKNPWTVRIDGISIDRLSEIWVDMYRFQGNARLAGRFRLRPGLEAEVGPATIDFDSGQVRLGREPVLDVAPSRLTCRIEPWDPRVVKGDAVWQSLSGEVRMDGRVERLDFANYFVRRARAPRRPRRRPPP